MTENNKPDKSELCKLAYEMGYEHCGYAYHEYRNILENSQYPSELWLNGDSNTYPISDMVKESSSKNGYSRMIWKIEEKLGFDHENEDWNNEGIYHIIEDCSSSWESGAYHSLTNQEFKPESLPFVNE